MDERDNNHGNILAVLNDENLQEQHDCRSAGGVEKTW